MNQSGIKPTEFKVLVQPIKVDEKTKGGIILPGTARANEYKLAKVLAVGPGHLLPAGTYATPPVEVGDYVILGPAAGISIQFDGETVLMADADEVLAILNRQEATRV